MAKDDHMFEEVMKSLGVKPIGDDSAPEPRRAKSKSDPTDFEQIFLEKTRKTSSVENPLDAEDRELFLQAFERGRVVDKDASSRPREEKLARRKANKNEIIDDVLDLHGHTVEAALDELQTFITKAFTKSLRSVIVVTGKGKHSRDGKSVLRPRVEQWIRQKGGRYIRSYAEAPRAYGGKGAFIIYIRPT